MDWNDLPAQPPDPHIGEPPVAEPATHTPVGPASRPSGFRRTILTAGMAAALLVAGGAAAVAAASPDPSATPTPTPAGAIEPSTDGSSAPSSSTRPDRGTRVDCPHDADATPGATPTPAS